MIQSKAIKESPERSKLYLWWIESNLSKPYYWIEEKLSGFLYYTAKLYGWHKNVFKNDYDFDAHCLFAIMEYKLKRVQEALLNGCAVHEDRDLKALRLAIKLAGRLKEDNYSDSFFNRHERKWGKSTFWFTPIQDSECSTWNSSRPKAVFAEDKEQESKEFREMHTHYYNKMKREERWFYDILHKYLRNFWD